jgi:ligand-binding sensor domain-containing protein
MNRLLCFFILCVFLIVSCEDDDYINNYSAEVSFDVTYHFLKGKPIRCIDFDEQGNAYIGAGKDLHYSNGSIQKTYTLDYDILDLAVAPDQTVWIGTKDGGLCHFTHRNLEWYNSENSGLPRDLIMNVEVSPDGKVWFASCAHKLGGLGIYDDGKFTFLTPENSPLNQNIIVDIEIDNEGSVFIATAGTVGRTNIYRIKDNQWKCLGDEKGTFYWLWSFTIGPSGIIYLIEDFSLSSYAGVISKFYRFRDDDWENITLNDDHQLSAFSVAIEADKRDYCWFNTAGHDGLILCVYTGNSWKFSPEGIISGSVITEIESDHDNNIWIGTYSDGIYILEQ